MTMFDFLKKKITNLVDRLAGKPEGPKEENKESVSKPEGKKSAPGPAAAPAGLKPASIAVTPVKKGAANVEAAQDEGAKIAKPAAEKAGGLPIPHRKGAVAEKTKAEHAGHRPQASPTKAHEQKPKQGAGIGEGIALTVGGGQKSELPASMAGIAAAAKDKMEAAPGAGVKMPNAEPLMGASRHITPKPREGKKAVLSFMSQIKSALSSEVELSEGDVAGVLDDFELELLESDVALEVAEQIKGELKAKLVGSRVSKKRLAEEIRTVFFDSIRRIMAENKGKTLLAQFAEISARPIKVMFSGPNGSGKTTTIAKIADMLIRNKYSVAIAAADTFRAAAIEQMQIHGAKLGVKVIAGKYGADPTSVAYDAVNYAKAHGVDVVLIDTAGRQETNQNLLNELKKMVRVLNPEIKLYIGESIAGNSIIEQVSAFNRELKLDGIILTKLDCDGKGGTVISISKVTKVPVLYVTTGQGYGDIEVFDEEKIARNIAG